MEEIFYTMIFCVAVIFVLALAYKVDERLGKLLIAPFIFGFLAIIILSIFSIGYYMIDESSFKLEHPELYQYVPKFHYKNLLIELLGIICIFYSCYSLFVETNKGKSYSMIRFLIFLLVGIFLVLKF